MIKCCQRFGTMSDWTRRGKRNERVARVEFRVGFLLSILLCKIHQILIRLNYRYRNRSNARQPSSPPIQPTTSSYSFAQQHSTGTLTAINLMQLILRQGPNLCVPPYLPIYHKPSNIFTLRHNTNNGKLTSRTIDLKSARLVVLSSFGEEYTSKFVPA